MKLRLLAGIVVVLAASAVSQAQDLPPLGSPQRVPGVSGFGSVMVYLKTQDGEILPDDAAPFLTLSVDASNSSLPHQAQRMGDGWMFSGLPIGNEYHVFVKAIGYQPASEGFEIPMLEGSVASVIVFLKPIDRDLTFRPPTGAFVLAPKAQKEIQRALQDLQQGKLSSAQKHADKAVQLAPGNPYVQYVVGMSYMLSKRFEQAKGYLEAAVSIDPTQPVALGALGGLRYQLGDDAGAIQALTKAVQLDPTSWKDEWFLACSYLRQKQFAESAEHAEQALKLGQNKARLAEIILGEAQADLGQREKAIATFETFARENPSDPNAKNALQWAEMLRHPPAKHETPSDAGANRAAPKRESVTTGLPLPPADVPPPNDWAPPDVDVVKPPVTANVTCPVASVLESAGKNAELYVQHLQQFSAREEFQAIEIKRNGAFDRPATRTFNYLVLIDQVSPERFDVKEARDADVATKSPGRLADTGTSALALAFHPILQRDFEWKCEGIGNWNGHPAWVLHFQQRSDRPNALASFVDGPHQYALPLRGRAWVSKTGGHVLHLDTDLIEEIRPIRLKRQHFSIDYSSVAFPTHHIELWLPERVDAYIQYQGRFLHYYHHFSDFKLFWVGASQKIGAPKDTVSKNPTPE